MVMVVYNDQTLAELRKRSPLDRGLLAKALANLDKMGAKAIGIDILFDQPQDEDDAAGRHAAGDEDAGRGRLCRCRDQRRQHRITTRNSTSKRFLARLAGSKAKPASVRLNDRYGVDPRLARNPRRPAAGARPRGCWPRQATADRTLPGYTGSIALPPLRQTATCRLFQTLPIQTFRRSRGHAPSLAPAIAGRYVLIGGDIVDIDRVATPLSEWSDAAQPPGLQVHAEMIAQMLDGKAPAPPAAGHAVGVRPAVRDDGGAHRPARMGQLAHLCRCWRRSSSVMLGVPFLLQWRGVDTYGLPAVGWVLGWILAFTAVTSAARTAGAVQRNFAQGALGKYLPREMAHEIIERPELLALHGEKKRHLRGVQRSRRLHQDEPRAAARTWSRKLLNRYLDDAQQGGARARRRDRQVRRRRGGGVLGRADRARPTTASAPPGPATRCGRRARHSATRSPRRPGAAAASARPASGMHFGEAVVGNFGGENRIQYTALGDSMNTAARLEAANKSLDVQRAGQPRDWSSAAGSTGGARWAGSSCAGGPSRSTCSTSRPIGRPRTRKTLAEAVALMRRSRPAVRQNKRTLRALSR